MVTKEGGMKPRFLLDPTGNLRIWDMPDPTDSYVIGADIADGISGGDYSCAQVISVKKFKQVAVWHGLEEPYEFGRTLFLLGTYFNCALLAPEVNASGITSVSYLRKNNYPNLYHMKILDTTFPEETDRLGWRTMSNTRRLLIDTLRTVVKENSLLLMDPETLDEMKTFVKNVDTKKIEASAGNCDDRVMALGIAVAVAMEMRESLSLTTGPDVSYVDRFRESQGGNAVTLGRGGY